MRSSLICGCGHCGCACSNHAASGQEEPCAQHRPVKVPRFIIGEPRAVVALALFAGIIGIWAKILGG